MARTIDTAGLRTLLQDGAAPVQLVEVLPAAEFETEHHPGAVHLPLTDLTRRRAEAALDPARPVVVYCFDFQ